MKDLFRLLSLLSGLLSPAPQPLPPQPPGSPTYSHIAIWRVEDRMRGLAEDEIQYRAMGEFYRGPGHRWYGDCPRCWREADKAHAEMQDASEAALRMRRAREGR